MAGAAMRIVRLVGVTGAILTLGLGSMGTERAGAAELPDLVIRVCRIGDGVPYPNDPTSITGGHLVVRVRNVGAAGFGTPNQPFNIHLYDKYSSRRQTFFGTLAIRAGATFTADFTDLDLGPTGTDPRDYRVSVDKVYFENGEFSFSNRVRESNENNNEFRFNFYRDVPVC